MAETTTQSNPSLQSLRINRTEQKKKFPVKRVIIILAILIILGAVGYLSVKGFPVQVEIATVTEMTSSQANTVLTANGYVVAQRKAAVSSKISGKLVSLNVIEGDKVEAGQIIAKIESADAEALLQQAKAQSEMSTADLEQAETELNEAEREYNRRIPLEQEKSIPTMELDLARTRVARAKAIVNARKASIKVALASIRNAEVQLENTFIRAPFRGTVLTKNANVGEVITALGSSAGARGAVVTLADMASLEVETDVSESKIERVRQGQPCEIGIDAYPGKRYKGYINKVIPTADRGKATVQVKVRFNDIDDKVLPEMGAKVYFLRDESGQQQESKSRLLLPASSVVSRDNKKIVYVISGEIAQEREVTTGDVVESFVEVISGVKKGEQVVLKPEEGFKNGSKITLNK